MNKAVSATATFPTRIESRFGKTLNPEEIAELTRAREEALARLLMLYIVTGLGFMLLPGTFLGVWNLIAISGREAADSISPSWIQAHGSAQVFGWIGTFILGIGFYSIPKLRRMEPFALWAARLCWAIWTAGVLLRWVSNVYAWHWRVLVPVSAALQLAAFAVFFHSVSGHKPPQAAVLEVLRPNGKRYPRFEIWAVIVIGATVGLMLTLIANFAGALYIALYAATPALPPAFDERFLVLAAWGFLVPFVWGFSAKWLPVFLGLQATRNRLLAAAFLMNTLGVMAALCGRFGISAVTIWSAALLAPLALRMFERPQQKAKLQGVHSSFPWFVRLAYVWAMAAAGLGIWAAWAGNSTGIGGASRHALTVGFLALMVFNIGQRVLPAFSGMRLLFSPRLMFTASLLLAFGCLLRVTSEILAYRNYAAWAWHCLPVSAVTELTAVTLFAGNLVLTFLRPPAPQMAATRATAN
jgi:uncharacterized protein involved in response to NO